MTVINIFDGSLIERDRDLRSKWEKVLAFQNKLYRTRKKVREMLESLDALVEGGEKACREYEEEFKKAQLREQRRWRTHEKKLIETLGRPAESPRSAALQEIEENAIAQARSVAIFESILFAIENWAVDDSPATDFTVVAQAFLFKAVYAQIMRKNTDYYLDSVPFAAVEVVRRGREYVKGVREDTQAPLTDSSLSIIAAEYQAWWVNDALALLYSGRDPDWETTKPHTMEEMALWRSTDMDKTQNFPSIFDAFDLTRKYGEEIRESSGLPEFTKQIMQTRLTAHE